MGDVVVCIYTHIKNKSEVDKCLKTKTKHENKTKKPKETRKLSCLTHTRAHKTLSSVFKFIMGGLLYSD